MADIQPILDHLNHCRAGLLDGLNQVPSDRWTLNPSPIRWSAAQVVAHLIMVEQAITGKTAALLRSQPRPIPLWKKLHLPLFLVSARVIRRESPIPLDPSLVADKMTMLGGLDSARGETIQVLRQNQGNNLGAYYWPHPFFGYLNLYEWFRVMGLHEVRHTKQIREIVDSFHR